MKARRCRATAKGTGKRCRRSAILGAVVCRVHGGAAPQVKAAASERLKEMQDPALDRLADLLNSATSITIHGPDGDRTVPLLTAAPHAVLGAAKAVLDRTGLEAGSRVQVSSQWSAGADEFPHPDYSNIFSETIQTIARSACPNCSKGDPDPGGDAA